MNLYDERGHLTEYGLTVPTEELSFDQLLERTEHIAACSHCAERFALCAVETPEPEPIGLVTRTVEAVAAERGRERNRKFASFFKVAVAAAFAVTLFGSGMFTKLIDAAIPAPSEAMEMAERQEEKRESEWGFLQRFGEFASAVNKVDMGGNRHDTKE